MEDLYALMLSFLLTMLIWSIIVFFHFRKKTWRDEYEDHLNSDKCKAEFEVYNLRYLGMLRQGDNISESRKQEIMQYYLDSRRYMEVKR